MKLLDVMHRLEYTCIARGASYERGKIGRCSIFRSSEIVMETKERLVRSCVSKNLIEITLCVLSR